MPVQRTVNWSVLISGSGEPVFQSKLIVESVRTRVGVPVNGFVLEWFEKYSPCRPVPLPTAELLKKLAVTTELTSFDNAATALTATLFVSTNGPVYKSELVVGVELSTV